MRAKPRPRWTSTFGPLALVGLAGLTSCSSLTAVFDRSPETSLDQVDDLLGHIERAHLECELSRQASMSVLDSLHTVVAPEFRGDAILAHQELLASLEASKAQADVLRESLAPMTDAAEAVVVTWQGDLDSFVSPRMRERSQERLQSTNALYAEVHVSLQAAAEFYQLYNLGLGDHALYLGNDLNASSVAAIQEELLLVTELAGELDARLVRCMDACQEYVRETALRGQLAVPQVATLASAAPEPAPSLRPGNQP